MLSDTGVLAGAVLLRPMVPLEPAAPPDLRGVPVLISAGRADPIVPAALVDRLGVLLGDAGAEVEMQWQPGGHGLTRGDIEVASAFLQRHESGFGISSLTGKDGPEHLQG
jgi:phospholipase/carboxylesterase